MSYHCRKAQLVRPGAPSRVPVCRRVLHHPPEAVAGEAYATRDPAAIANAVAVLRKVSAFAPRMLDGEEAAALAVIYRSYAGMLLRIAGKLLDSSWDAEDVVHDVFSRLPRLLGQYRDGGLGGWLRRLTVNECLMQLRSPKHRRERQISPAHDGVLMQAVWPDALLEQHDLERALGTLPERLRSVVVLKYFLGYSHMEIGHELGISPNASEVRLCRALKQLRWSLAVGETASEAMSA